MVLRWDEGFFIGFPEIGCIGERSRLWIRFGKSIVLLGEYRGSASDIMLIIQHSV